MMPGREVLGKTMSEKHGGTLRAKQFFVHAMVPGKASRTLRYPGMVL